MAVICQAVKHVFVGSSEVIYTMIPPIGMPVETGDCCTSIPENPLSLTYLYDFWYLLVPRKNLKTSINALSIQLVLS